MPRFGDSSRMKLDTCHSDIQRLFLIVVRSYDCSVIWGNRGKVAQTKAFDSGNSKKQWPDSKHNKLPSDAIDIIPYPINWGDTGTTKERQKAIARFYHFAGYVEAKAENLGIKMRWGGDWDSDRDFSDQNFDDLAHWEIMTQ